jgi:hypothetical protein
MKEYKGIYYNENTETQKFYEGGAHFKYSSLYKILECLHNKQTFRQNSQPSRNIKPPPQYQQAYNHTLTQILLDNQKQKQTIQTRNHFNSSNKDKELSQTIMNYNFKKTNKQNLSSSTNQKQTITISTSNNNYISNKPYNCIIPLDNANPTNINHNQFKRNNNLNNSVFNGKTNSISKNKKVLDKKYNENNFNLINSNRTQTTRFNIKSSERHSVTLRKKGNCGSNCNNTSASNHFSASASVKNRHIVSSIPKRKTSLCKSLDRDKSISQPSIKKNKKSRNSNTSTAISCKSINLSKSKKKTNSLYTLNNKTIGQNNFITNKLNNKINKRNYEIVNNTNNNMTSTIMRNNNNYTQLYLKKKINKDDSIIFGLNGVRNNIVSSQRRNNSKKSNNCLKKEFTQLQKEI